MITTFKIGHMEQGAYDLNHAVEIARDYISRFAEARSIEVTMRREERPVPDSLSYRNVWTVSIRANWPEVREEETANG